MKVLISVDMEGVTGVTDPEDVLPEGADYSIGRMLMTSDANGAILGAFDAGATEVVVNDSHWTARNLLLQDLDPRARLIRGFHKPLCMVHGIDETFDALVCVGYHSCAGTEGGVLNHTLLGKEIQNLFLNGEPIGETRLNALLAGHFGVPLAFVAGDEAVCREAKSVLANDLATYAVKDGIDMFCASCLHPTVTQAGIREGVAAALRNIGECEPYRMEEPYTFGLEWNSTTIASTCEYIPGIRKPSPRTTEYTTTDMPEAMRLLFAECILAMQVGQKGIYS